MQISHLLAGSADPLSVGKRNDSVESVAASATALMESRETPQGTAALRRIAARYDVTEITPREFSQMLQKLYEAGALSEQQWQELAVARLDLDQENIDPDETVNLVDFYANKLEKLFGAGGSAEDAAGASKSLPSPQAVQRLLGWMEKFALIQSGDAAGIDALV